MAIASENLRTNDGAMHLAAEQDALCRRSLAELRAEFAAIDNDSELMPATHIAARIEALDTLEFHIIDRIDSLLQHIPHPALMDLKQAAERLKQRLEGINARLFRRIRAEIRAGSCRGPRFRTMLATCLGADPIDGSAASPGYDSLDSIVQYLFHSGVVPDAAQHHLPDMVQYQPTPARVIAELVSRAQFGADDWLYDLGSGLGRVVMLAHLLGGVRATGIEIEPAYCAYARKCAERLHLQGVSFLNQDARYAEYDAGTVFFLYTPFTGRMLLEVLAKLRQAAQRRTIRIFSYGPCTPIVAQQPWLVCASGPPSPHTLGAFYSR